MGFGKESKNADDFVAGAVAGAFSRMAIAPLDVLKIRFQVQNETGVYRYNSIASAIDKILRKEGITAFWKGNTPAMLMVVPYSAIQFATFYELKASGIFRWREPVSSFAMGGISGICATIWTYPLDLLRTRLAAQTEPKMYRGLFDAVRVIWKKEGLFGLYAGFSPTLIEIVPYIALSFSVYETTKNIWARKCDRTDLTVVESVTIGGVAGTLSKLAILPLDNVKKRMQVQSQFRKQRYAGVWQALSTIVRREGMKGLFRGAAPSLIKAAPYTGITFASYEFTKGILLRRRSAQVSD